MAFALSIVHLQEVMKKPGCPICRLEHESAVQSIDSFLWENVNNAGVRAEINDAYGFCGYHTRMLVATELSQSGHVLGVNKIYETLLKKTSGEIKTLHPKRIGLTSIQGVLDKFGFHKGEKCERTVLAPQGDCPICVLAEGSGDNAMGTLLEELNGGDEEFRKAYQRSYGVCIKHFRKGLCRYAQRYPMASGFLIDDASQRLDEERDLVLQYIQKQNWANKEEKLTDEERTAWLRALTFFIGLPPDKFDHKIPKF
jgi:hypothetical protein